MRFIIGCDFHPGYQQIAMLDTQTGEVVERSLAHENKEEVRKFYAGLPGPARVGIEASGSSQWFERGYVTYSNAAKEQSIDVRASDLATFGAVSRTVVEQMAMGALEAARTGVKTR